MAIRIFRRARVHWWSDYGYEGEPAPKCTWHEVYHPPDLIVNQRRCFIYGLPHPGYHIRDVVGWVLKAFEKIHAGMDGLRLYSAEFPAEGGYKVVQSSTGGLDRVNSIKDWTNEASSKSNRMAYWATRLHNNSITVNVTLLKVLQTYCADRVGLLYVEIDNKMVPVKLSSLTNRTVGLTPRSVGTIVEPPFETRVPPSEDGETYHTFLVGQRQDTNEPIAIDVSAAQYGVIHEIDWGFCGEEAPILVLPLVRFLRVLGKHRMLTSTEMSRLATYDSHAMVRNKVDECLLLALENAWDGPIEN